MIKLQRVLFLCIAIVFLNSCEEEAVNIPEFVIPDTGKVILVEELTGVSCPNCPSGAAQLENILNTYEGKIVAVGIHGDQLTQPVEGSQFDFRTQASKELEDSFTFFGKPTAVINRNTYDEDRPFGLFVQQWNQAIADELEEPQTVEIALSKEYDADTRALIVTVTAGALVNLEGNLHLTVLLTEDNIIDAQKNVSVIIPDFKHKHVLRTVLSSNTFGDLVGTGLAANETITRSFTFNLPPEDGTWVAENINIVAHLRSDIKVLQAAEIHLVD